MARLISTQDQMVELEVVPSERQVGFRSTLRRGNGTVSGKRTRGGVTNKFER